MAKLAAIIQGLKAAHPISSNSSKSIDNDNDSDDSGEMMSVPKHDIYSEAKNGPFKCSNCEHYPSPNTCDQPYIVKLRGSKVEPDACCDLFETK